jgi:hypothetical protein
MDRHFVAKCGFLDQCGTDLKSATATPLVRMPASEEFSVQLARTGSAPVNARGGLMASTLHPNERHARAELHVFGG